MLSNDRGPQRGGRPMQETLSGTTGPAVAVVVSRDAVEGRLTAELDGRMAVGTQVLIVETGDLPSIDPVELNVLDDAASWLQDEDAGSMVLRHASARLLGQLRVMHLGHMFGLEADLGPAW